jgi:L-fucose isomerase-like protein
MTMPAGDGSKDSRSPRIACLAIGREWTASAKAEMEALLSGLTSGRRLETSDPVFAEVDVLDRVEQLRLQRPDAIVLAALHGGSARSMVLAARKANVPALLWCHDGQHSLPSACLANEALRQIGHPSVLIHGCGSKAAGELDAALGAACALRRLSEARIGQVGPLHPNLVSCGVNPLAIQKGFGAWTVPVAVAEVRRRVECLDGRRVFEGVSDVRRRFHVEADDELLMKGVALHFALREIAREQRLDILAVDCWSEILPGFGVTPCMGFAFDDYSIACEGDLLLALALLAGEAISGGPGFGGDLYAFDESNGRAVSVHCGACAALHSAVDRLSIVSRPLPDNVSGNGAILSVRPVLQAGRATAVMLHGMNADHVHIRAAEILDTTFDDLMSVHVRIEDQSGLFRAQAAGNHYAIFPGEWLSAWSLLAQWLHITVH